MKKKNQISVRKIKQVFFENNSDLKEILIKEDGKERGYGYVYSLIEGHHFAIPLRSSINHKFGFMIATPANNRKGYTGLDYTKAMIVSPKDLGLAFIIPNNQFSKIYRNENKIIEEFSEYVSVYKEYVLTKKLPEQYINAFTYSTLINYHDELGLNNKNDNDDENDDKKDE